MMFISDSPSVCWEGTNPSIQLDSALEKTPESSEIMLMTIFVHLAP